jgi:hypothetical protein
MELLYGAAPFGDNTQTTSPQWVKNDNPHSYDMMIPDRTIQAGQSSQQQGLAGMTPKRHVLGLVGGNNVSQIVGNRQDLESDLRGLTRPLTNAPARQWQPLKADAQNLSYDNRKTHLAIDIRKKNLEEFQMWAYPATFAPQPLHKETCQAPHKY